jgi:hypothetical protein
MHQPPRID